MTNPVIYLLVFPIVIGALSATPYLFPALRRILQRNNAVFFLVVFGVAGIAFIITFALCYWFALDPFLQFSLVSNPEGRQIYLQKNEIFREAWLNVMTLGLIRRCFSSQTLVCEYAGMLSSPFMVLLSFAWVSGSVSFITNLLLSARIIESEKRFL